MELRFGQHGAFTIADSWCSNMSVSFVEHTVGTPGRSVTITADPSGRAVSAEEYAARQGEVLQGALESYEEIRFAWYEADGRSVPVREYRWRQHDTEIRQCQAYLPGGDYMWTMTLTADANGYDSLVAMAPELIQGFIPGPGTPS
ncbi:MAG: DcrB-related protein [Rhizobiaceae bacterium]|nr:DcrB-related protein [Rhizobiaceae bacterium]MCV0405826.1 DcrB-related protein [Rhizobiaceae bacterium]